MRTHTTKPITRRYLVLVKNFLCALSVPLFFGAAFDVHAQTSDADVIQRLKDGRHVLMIRHAIAPGTGDPVDFTLGDCSTQRNLDENGRVQARAIGAWLKSNGINTARVYSSQWCRCMETAELMGIGKPVALPALNSFYELTENREANLRALRQFLAARPSGIEPIVLITHQVTISAITGAPTASGEGMLIEIGDDERYTVQARLDFGQ